MAATSTTETWDAAWTLTMRAERKRLTDNIFDEYPFLQMLRRAGQVEVESGGKEFKEDLMYAKNTGTWFSGYDTVGTDAVDGITAGFAPVRYISVPITISLTEEAENNGSAVGSKNLLVAKSEQSMLTIRDTVNAAAWSATSGKKILGMQDIVADSPTTGTLMGINRANESWWRNTSDATSTDFDASSSPSYSGPKLMSSVYNTVSSGNDTPTHIYTTLTFFGEYENILEGTGYARVSGGEGGRTGLDAGTPFFRKAGVFSDRDVSSGHMYLVNRRYLKLKILSKLNFAKTPFKEPADQHAKVGFIVLGCNLVTNNSRRHGVLTTLT